MRPGTSFNSAKRSPRQAIRTAVLEVLEGRRLLSFAAPASYPVGAFPLAIVSADFNNDGRSDVATANSTSSTVSVLLSNANGTFQPAQDTATGSGPQSVAVGDVNGDGRADLVTANGGDVSVLLGNGNGTFQPAQSVTLPAQFPPGYPGVDPVAQSPSSVAVGDINADGKLDLVVAGRTVFAVHYTGYYGGYYTQYIQNSYVNVLIGNGFGAFANGSTSRDDSFPSAVGVADFNGDTKLDVVLEGNGARVLLGNGNGTLQSPLSSGYGYTSGPAPIGDFNADGKLDLLLNGGGGAVLLLKGNGNGTFQNPTSLPYVGGIRSIAAGDLNGDGKLDVVVNTGETHYSGYGYYGGYDPVTTDSTKVLFGYGDGSFTQPISTTVGSHDGYITPSVSALADFNGDARPDLASAETYGGAVLVQLNANDWVVPPGISISDATVTEGNSTAVNAAFTVTLSKTSAQTVTVQFAVAGGLAVAGRDFDAQSNTLTFAPGDTSKTINVSVRGDVIDEYDEDFYVNLSSATNAELADSQGLGTILDNDAAPSIVINNVSLKEGGRGTIPFNFTVSLSAASEKDITVNFETANGSAQTGDNDYIGTSGTLFFAAGQTSKTITVTVRADKRRETSETFFVNLTGTTNGIITDSQGVGTILNDDQPGRKR